MPPGNTSIPVASRTVWPSASIAGATRAIFSPSIKTSASFVSFALTTLPPLISVAMLPPRPVRHYGSLSCHLRRRTVRGAGRAFGPGLRCEARRPLHHCDALVDRANQRAEVAANALCLVYSRDALERDGIWPDVRLRWIELGDWRHGNRLEPVQARLGVDFDLSVHNS